MTLRIRAIDLSAQTEQGEFGARVAFSAGLNVVSAANTRGKSTLVQAAVFALGLEKMLSPRREVPLPRVMTVELQETRGSPEIPVLASRVMLEVENTEGRVVTLQRTAKGEEDTRLIRVFGGAALTSSSSGLPANDYFALDPGAALSSTGIHSFLADFLGWTLPRVPRFNGGESPLYLEALFALFIVEQKVGWSALPANFPTYLGLRDMPRRAVEYVLGLKVHETELQRHRIASEMSVVRERWAAVVEELDGLAEGVSGRLEGLPTVPDLNSEPQEAQITLPRHGKWVELSEILSHMTQELRLLEDKPVPRAGDETLKTRRELDVVLKDLTELRGLRHELSSGLATERAQVRATERQLEGIAEDLERHRDLNKIRRLGGAVESPLVGSQCPTCHQEVQDSLLPSDVVDRTMTIEENEDFLREQQKLFTNLLARGRALVEKQEKELVVLSQRLSDLQQQARAFEDTLVSASNAPSTASVQARIELKANIRTLDRVAARLTIAVGRLEPLKSQWRRLTGQLERLPSPGLVDADKQKLAMLARLIKEQLAMYGFSTFKPDDIQVGEDTYRPIREGFEIGFELSASDAIRLKWAYQLALLETASAFSDTHHAGLLVFDEPRQQETAPLSFHRLIERASRVSKDLQVIFTTSEDKPALREAVRGLDLNLIDLPGYLLQPR